ncbi:MAG: hypothetical protein LBE04_00255 [Prevotellaceae bacterium]|nr:hypothetical protein [Prevotellaceae bacterium]
MYRAAVRSYRAAVRSYRAAVPKHVDVSTLEYVFEGQTFQMLDYLASDEQTKPQQKRE